jgi:hypothetical protein
VTEAQWQAQVVQLASLLGWSSYHVHDSRRTNPGWPDLVLWRPGDRILFRELKTNIGRIRPEQAAVLRSLADAGADTGVWRPRDFDEVRAVLERRVA